MRFSNAMLYVLTQLVAISPVMAGDLPTPASKRPSDKVVCKTETVVGTLIPGPKRCHTLSEWDEHARAAQALAHRLVDDNRSRSAGLE